MIENDLHFPLKFLLFDHMMNPLKGIANHSVLVSITTRPYGTFE